MCVRVQCRGSPYICQQLVVILFIGVKSRPVTLDPKSKNHNSEA